MKIKKLMSFLTTILSISTFSVLLNSQNVQASSSSCCYSCNDSSNILVNGSFERPVVGRSGINFYNHELVPGWKTTNNNSLIELWGEIERCYYGGGVNAVDGKQICEVNAKGPSDVYQDVTLNPGDQIYWAIYHRGTLGTDTMDILIGAPGRETLQKTVTTKKTWMRYYGYYTVPAGQTTTRIMFKSVASFLGKTVNGNLIDCAYATVVKKGPEVTLSTLSGTVIDKNTRQPIQNATVTVTGNGKTYTVNTDASGNYKIDSVFPGNYAVTATSDGYNNFETTISVQGNKKLDMELEATIKTVKVSGTVTDKNTDLPIPGAKVELSANGQTFTGTTNASGQYTINSVPTGNYTTKTTADGYNPLNETLNVDKDKTYDVKLEKSIILVTVSGTVTDKNTGLPISGAKVELSGNGQTFTGTTNASGQYTINSVPTGNYTTKTTASGYNEVSGSLNVDGNKTYNVQLERAMVTVSGTVTDKNTGLPISGAKVELSGNGEIFVGTTNASGQYVINSVSVGIYTTKTTADGYSDVSGSLNVDGNKVYNVQLERKMITLSGIVIDKDSRAIIQNATVVISSNGQTFNATTDSTGSFVVNNIPAGEYTITTTAKFYLENVVNITVLDNTNTTIELAFKKIIN